MPGFPAPTKAWGTGIGHKLKAGYTRSITNNTGNTGNTGTLLSALSLVNNITNKNYGSAASTGTALAGKTLASMGLISSGAGSTSHMLGVAGPAVGAIFDPKNFNAFVGMGTIVGGPVGGIVAGMATAGLNKGENKRPGFSASDWSSAKGTYLEPYIASNPSFTSGISQAPYREGGKKLAGQRETLKEISNRESRVQRSLGLTQLAWESDRIRGNFKRLPSSQQDEKNINDNIFRGLMASHNIRNSILDSIIDNPTSSAEFLAKSGGISIGTVKDTLKADDDRYIRNKMYTEARAERERYLGAGYEWDGSDTSLNLETENRIKKIVAGHNLVGNQMMTSQSGLVTLSDAEVKKIWADAKVQAFDEGSAGAVSRSGRYKEALDAVPNLPAIDSNILAMVGDMPSRGYTSRNQGNVIFSGVNNKTFNQTQGSKQFATSQSRNSRNIQTSSTSKRAALLSLKGQSTGRKRILV
ncbi:MAG: hypothetical protein GY928_34470 [Colwellia sp.]|nr:hypothetical protein [Colwellia sp.]